MARSSKVATSDPRYKSTGDKVAQVVVTAVLILVALFVLGRMSSGGTSHQYDDRPCVSTVSGYC